MVETTAIIHNYNELYAFLINPTPTYGIIVENGINISFALLSNYRKILTTSIPKITFTTEVNY